MRTHRTLRHVLVALVPLAVVCSCAGVPTQYDYDPLYSFGELRTFEWRLSSAARVMDPFVVRYVEAAVRRDLLARGFQASDSPDFFVVLRDEFEDRLAVDERSGAFRRPVSARDLHEDDLILQVVEADSGRIVWRGVASNVIDVRAPADERRARIERAVSSLLKDFPPTR